MLYKIHKILRRDLVFFEPKNFASPHKWARQGGEERKQIKKRRKKQDREREKETGGEERTLSCGRTEPVSWQRLGSPWRRLRKTKWRREESSSASGSHRCWGYVSLQRPRQVEQWGWSRLQGELNTHSYTHEEQTVDQGALRHQARPYFPAYWWATGCTTSAALGGSEYQVEQCSKLAPTAKLCCRVQGAR